MKRLEQSGYLQSEDQRDANRQVRYYRCTASGRAALRQWLSQPLKETAALSSDPVRTRLLYLHRLPKSKRRTWFEAVEQTLQHKLSAVLDLHSEIDELAGQDAFFARLVHEHAVLELRTRIKWLNHAKLQMQKNDLL